MTVRLNTRWYFSWSEWIGWFGAGLARGGLENQLNGCENDFLVCLETPESVLHRLDNVSLDQLACANNIWQNLHMAT